jgi:catalase (peroxidase I)|eukprot:COSAG02_NODE_39233_length_419_cov_1.146875_1_plen_100_part_00
MVLACIGTDLQLRWEPTLAVIAEEYASDEALFLQEFSDAWVKLMNIDRFDGPAGSSCSDGDRVHEAEEKAESVVAAEEPTHAGEEEGKWDVSSLMTTIL